MELTVDIKESGEKISQLIGRAIAEHLNGAFLKAALLVRKPIQELIKGAIRKQEEYIDLLYGSFYYEVGIPDIAGRIMSIMDVWVGSLDIVLKKVKYGGRGLSGGMVLQAIQNDYSDVLSMQEAVFITEKHDELRWLQWLLLEGNRPIIQGWNIDDSGRYIGRTGRVIMVPSKANWKIPKEYQGTPRNNFLTRALSSIEKELLDVIQKAVEKSV